MRYLLAALLCAGCTTTQPALRQAPSSEINTTIRPPAPIFQLRCEDSRMQLFRIGWGVFQPMESVEAIRAGGHLAKCQDGQLWVAK